MKEKKQYQQIIDKMGGKKFQQITFPMLGTDDSVNRIFFDAGEFNLE